MSEQLIPFVFAHALRETPSIEFTPDEAKQFRCRARALYGGTPEMEDDRVFHMPPEDLPEIFAAFKRRLKFGTVPALYEHGWGAMGGEAGGKVLEVYAQDGDIWAVQELDEDYWKGAVKPGLKWHSRSVGFDGWMDKEDRIRCADIKEISVTNKPAMRGLGAVERFETFEARMRERKPFVQLESGVVVPAHSAPVPTPAPVAAASETDSPAEASKPQEQPMKSESLALLGLEPGAKPEDIDNAIAKHFAAKAKEPVPVEKTATGDDAPVKLSDVRKALSEFKGELTKQLTDELRAENAALQRTNEITGLLAQARKDGRISNAEEPEWKEILSVPQAFEAAKKRLAALPQRHPSREAFDALAAMVDGADAETFQAGASNVQTRSALASEAMFLAQQEGIDINEAIARLSADATGDDAEAN